jgi:hypothetical protein
MAELVDRAELERILSRAVSAELRAELRKLMDLLGDPPDPANVPEAFWSNGGASMRTRVEPILRDIYLGEASERLGQLTIGVDWALVNQAAIEWARQYSFELIAGITERSRAVTQTALGDYFRNPLTIGELEQQLSPTFGAVRAEMIAVTEVTRAKEMGDNETIALLLKENPGIRRIDTWMTSKDDKVCLICGPLDGRKAEHYDGAIPFWRHPVMDRLVSIPAHPRCRCRKWVDFRAVNA